MKLKGCTICKVLTGVGILASLHVFLRFVEEKLLGLNLDKYEFDNIAFIALFELIIFFMGGAFVLYKFYCKKLDIYVELKKLRYAHQERMHRG